MGGRYRPAAPCAGFGEARPQAALPSSNPEPWTQNPSFRSILVQNFVESHFDVLEERSEPLASGRWRSLMFYGECALNCELSLRTTPSALKVLDQHAGGLLLWSWTITAVSAVK